MKISVYIFTGMAIQDVVSAKLVYDKIQAEKI